MALSAMNIQAIADLMVLLDVDSSDTKTIAWLNLMVPRTELDISMYCNNDFMVDVYDVDMYNNVYSNVSELGTVTVDNGGSLDFNIDDGSNIVDDTLVSSVYTFPAPLVSVLEDLIVIANVRRGAEGKSMELVGEYRNMYEADIPPMLKRKLNKYKFMRVI
jgi:hypothetical protein